jgi:hypothetical protein
MPRAHQRRFRFFLKLLKAGEIVHAPAARRRRPREVAEEAALDCTIPLLPVA